jgi:hypothetical protein
LFVPRQALALIEVKDFTIPESSDICGLLKKMLAARQKTA